MTINATKLARNVRDYRPRCPGCSLAVLTDMNVRPCSFYDCPGLPEELEVTCDMCMYDFAAQDGQPTCDHSTCATALRLQEHVPIYRAWLELLADEAQEQSEIRRPQGSSLYHSRDANLLHRW